MNEVINDSEKMLSIRELSEKLNISYIKMFQLSKEDGFPKTKVGKVYRFYFSEVYSFLKGKGNE